MPTRGAATKTPSTPKAATHKSMEKITATEWSLVTASFIGPKKAQPVKAMNTTNAAAINPVAPFLPPFKTRIREINGLTASEISTISRNENRIGDSSENAWMNTNSAAPRIK
jgi:hypothetical protein